jgi:prepilin-type N-terminal cleavage/methylation domain-containing protein
MRKAFTLIELLIVIAIIAVLGTIVLSSLLTSREKVGVSVTRSQLDMFDLAYKSYISGKVLPGETGDPIRDYGPQSEEELEDETAHMRDKGNTLFFQAITGKNLTAGRGPDKEIKRMSQPCVEIKDQFIKPSLLDPEGKRLVCVDHWENPYIYVYPIIKPDGTRLDEGMLYSRGPNRIDEKGSKEGDKDDIKIKITHD